MEGVNQPSRFDALESDSEVIDAEVELFEVPIATDEAPPVQLAILNTDPPPEPPPEYQQVDGLGFAPQAAAPPAPERPYIPPSRYTAANGNAAGTGPGPKTKAKFKAMPTLQLPAVGTIKRAYGIFTFNPAPFLIIAFLASLPEVVELFMPEADTAVAAIVIGLAMYVFKDTIVSVFQGVTAYTTFQILRKSSVEVGEAFSKGFSHIVSVACVSILSSLIIYSGAVPAALFYAFVQNSYFSAAIFVIIPAIAIACVLIVAVPACVVERLGPLESIRRSMELTKGFRWAIFWILTVWYLYVIGIFFIVFIFMGFVGLRFPLVSWAVSALLSLCFLAVKNIIYAVIYHDLRAIKDGVDVTKLVRVFD